MIHGAPAGEVVNDAAAGTLRRPFAGGARPARRPPGGARTGVPEPTTMASPNRARVERCLDLLRRGLAPFIERELRRAVEARRQDPDFLRTVTTSARQEDAPLAQWDAAALLRLMWDLWNPVFRSVLGFAERSLVSELRTHRNNWAHQKPFSDDDAYRAVDSAARLLTAVSAPEATVLADLKTTMLRERFAAERPRPRPAAAEAPRRTPRTRSDDSRRHHFGPERPPANPPPTNLERPGIRGDADEPTKAAHPDLRPSGAVRRQSTPRAAAADRRRVLVGCDPPGGWRGSFTDWVCSMIRLADGGISYADLQKQIADLHGWAYSTTEVKVNGIRILGCLHKDGNRIEVTDRGRRFLEADGDPDLLRDHLLGHILGAREVLIALDTPRSAADLLQYLRPLKSAWRETEGPARQLIAFLRRLGVTAEVDRAYHLTERGENWRRAIPGDPAPAPPTT